MANTLKPKSKKHQKRLEKLTPHQHNPKFWGSGITLSDSVFSVE
jgi:hypothetical protein